MASAKKLPSGTWRCRATRTIDGKKITKSFTVSPDECGGSSKRAQLRAEALARNWMADVKAEKCSMTVKKAIEKYINSRDNVLSPSTIAGYYRMSNYFENILEMDIEDIDADILQAQINKMALDVSTKTIKNRIFFLISALDFAGVHERFSLRFPERVVPDLAPPEVNEYHRLLSAATGEQKLILVLAGLYTLRRGEIAALKGEDILRDMHCIYVHKSMVKDKNGKWVIKETPKTAQSVRLINVGKEIMDMIPVTDPDELVIKTNPNMITKNFDKLREKVCVSCRFHDLRKYAASLRSDMMPKKYVEAVGGWKMGGSSVLSSIYDKPFKDKLTEYQNQFNDAVVNEYGKELFGN